MREGCGALLQPAKGEDWCSKLTFRPLSLSLPALLPSPVHSQPSEKSRAVSKAKSSDNGGGSVLQVHGQQESSLSAVPAVLQRPAGGRGELLVANPLLDQNLSRRHGKRFEARTGCVTVVSGIFTSHAVSAAACETPPCRTSSRLLARRSIRRQLVFTAARTVDPRLSRTRDTVATGAKRKERAGRRSGSARRASSPSPSQETPTERRQAAPPLHRPSSYYLDRRTTQVDSVWGKDRREGEGLEGRGAGGGDLGQAAEGRDDGAGARLCGISEDGCEGVRRARVSRLSAARLAWRSSSRWLSLHLWRENRLTVLVL